MGHVSHSKKHLLTRPAARIVLVLAALLFTGAALHFAFTAYETSECTTGIDYFSTEQQSQGTVDSDHCRFILSVSEEHQRTAAAIAVLAIIVGIGAAVRLSNASRHTRRIVLAIEVVVVALGVFYTILLASVLH